MQALGGKGEIRIPAADSLGVSRGGAKQHAQGERMHSPRTANVTAEPVNPKLPVTTAGSKRNLVRSRQGRQHPHLGNEVNRPSPLAMHPVPTLTEYYMHGSQSIEPSFCIAIFWDNGKSFQDKVFFPKRPTHFLWSGR